MKENLIFRDVDEKNPSSIAAYEDSALKYMYLELANANTSFVDTDFVVNKLDGQNWSVVDAVIMGLNTRQSFLQYPKGRIMKRQRRCWNIWEL